MAAATTSADAVETMEETASAAAELGGARRTAEDRARSGRQWERNVATISIAACAPSPKQCLLAQPGPVKHHRTLSPTAVNSSNRRMRTRMSGGVRYYGLNNCLAFGKLQGNEGGAYDERNGERHTDECM